MIHTFKTKNKLIKLKLKNQFKKFNTKILIKIKSQTKYLNKVKASKRKLAVTIFTMFKNLFPNIENEDLIKTI